MLHKITKQNYIYECGDKCCTEFGTTWCLDGEIIYNGPQDEDAILNILSKFGIQAEIVDLNEDGEEICSLNNFIDISQEES